MKEWLQDKISVKIWKYLREDSECWWKYENTEGNIPNVDENSNDEKIADTNHLCLRSTKHGFSGNKSTIVLPLP